MAVPLIKKHLDTNGIMNKGNTCFFNSTMQCILSFSLLVRHFLDTQFDEKQPISLAFQHFLLSYKNSKIVDPTDFINLIRSKIKLFNGKQQDAHCFLESFISCLSSEDKTNFMKKHFEITIEDVVHCHSCSFSSKTITSTLIKYLDIKKSIQESIYSFISEREEIDSDAPYQCPNCKQRKKASISHNILKCSEFIALFLNRYLSLDEKNNKNTELSEEIVICEKTYELIGVVCHVGGLTSGHYYSYAKREDWREYNDSNVSKSNRPNSSSHAYILFYTLKN